ncbi:MAG: hypothetical protein PHF67_05620 [Candidatus Nanoarchaeia archaeon]|nr:hypothetical protein [Candidatus Nanoarchaeia archaeon]
MKIKKRYLIFGILFILFVNIIKITALGSGASLGGWIDIPMGNQTFPNMTVPSDDAENVDEIDDVDDEDAIFDEDEDEITIDEEDDEDSNDINNSITNATTNSITQQQTDSQSSSSNSNGFNKFFDNIIKKINPSNTYNDNVKENEDSEEIENPLDEEQTTDESDGLSEGNDVLIVLSVNTICLFVAFITLRDYNKSLIKR